MRRLLLILFIFSLSLPLFSQEEVSNQPKHAVKLNLLALPLRTFSGQYEIKVARKITFATTLNYMALGKIPYKDKISEWTEDDLSDIIIDQARMGNFSIAPEIRFYLSKKGAFSGFYVAPLVKYSNLQLELPIAYGESDVKAPFNGKIEAYSAGLQLGAQWKLFGPVGLDWWILGLTYGSSKGRLNYNQPLDQEAQAELSETLAELEVPMVDFDYEVTDQGARLLAKGPWAGIRAGLALTIKF